jgi:hypothetical protein
MSGIHFALDYGPQGCRITDRKSSNGTFLNGARITEAMLTNGDEVRSGQTIFAVHIVSDEKLATLPSAVPPAPAAPKPQFLDSPPSVGASEVLSTGREPAPAQRPSVPAPPPSPPLAAPRVPQTPQIAPERPSPRPEPLAPPPVESPRAAQPKPRAPAPPARPAVLTIGSWAFSFVPDGWQVKEEFGIERVEKDRFPSSVIATEEILGGGVPLQHFVESQLSMLRQYLREPKFEAIVPPAIPGADEKAAVDVRYTTKDGQGIWYRRIYARTSGVVGTITLTTLENDLAQLRPVFDAILAGATLQVKQ